MSRVPLARGVRQGLRALKVATRKALKGVNQVAGQRMAKGDYATAEGLAATGREVRQFLTEVDALAKRWREVSGSRGGKKPKSANTPLWGYYQPILQALDKAGGECRRTDLEAHVERVMASAFQPGDREATRGGRERWRVMVQRARRPLIAEGWLEDRGGKVWGITDSGRRAAEKPLRSDPALRGL